MIRNRRGAFGALVLLLVQLSAATFAVVHGVLGSHEHVAVAHVEEAGADCSSHANHDGLCQICRALGAFAAPGRAVRFTLDHPRTFSHETERAADGVLADYCLVHPSRAPPLA